MLKQLIGALSCLPFFCALFFSPISAEPSSQEASISEVQELIAEKLDREQTDQQEFENSEEEIVEDAQEENVVNRGIFYNEKEPVSSHNGGAWHYATGVSATGIHVFLQDGSGWMIAKSDATNTLDWTGSDLIWVTSAPWYSFYGYVLHNYRTDAKVYANLKEKPVEYNAFTFWIDQINAEEGTLVLSDRSVWEFGGVYDRNVANNWRVGQKVLIGINTSFWTSSKKPNLLISTEEGIDGYIRARCLY